MAIVVLLIGPGGFAAAQPASPAEDTTAPEASVATLLEALRPRGLVKTDVAVVIKNIEGSQESVTGKLLRFQNDVDVTWRPLRLGVTMVPVYNARSNTLSFSLAIGDGTGDVGEPIGKLEAMTRVSDDLSRPPMVLFVMGSFTYEGVIKGFSVTTPNIAADGRRLSAVVAIVLTGADKVLNAEEGLKAVSGK